MAEVVDHYNASAPTYTEQYDETMIHTATEDPANYFRLKKIKDRINELGIKSVYELVTSLKECLRLPSSSLLTTDLILTY